MEGCSAHSSCRKPGSRAQHRRPAEGLGRAVRPLLSRSSLNARLAPRGELAACKVTASPRSLTPYICVGTCLTRVHVWAPAAGSAHPRQPTAPLVGQWALQTLPAGTSPQLSRCLAQGLACCPSPALRGGDSHAAAPRNRGGNPAGADDAQSCSVHRRDVSFRMRCLELQPRTQQLDSFREKHFQPSGVQGSEAHGLQGGGPTRVPSATRTPYHSAGRRALCPGTRTGQHQAPWHWVSWWCWVSW